MADSLQIPKYSDSPFGCNLWIRGLFGVEDAEDYYQILATPEGFMEPIA